MGLRLRLIVVLLGALLVVATYTYPLWRPEPSLIIEEQGFPGLAEPLQAQFVELPPGTQNTYLRMASQNAMRALELLTAHLQPTGPLPPEEAGLPPGYESATVEATGEFQPIDPETLDEDRDLPPFYDLYRETSGEVVIYQDPDGNRLLRIEGLEVINGPDLWVALSPQPTPLSGEINELGNTYIDIDPLKASSGDQNYVNVPNVLDINLNNYASVVIYDRTHRVIFGVAQIN